MKRTLIGVSGVLLLLLMVHCNRGPDQNRLEAESFCSSISPGDDPDGVVERGKKAGLEVDDTRAVLGGEGDFAILVEFDDSGGSTSTCMVMGEKGLVTQVHVVTESFWDFL